MLGVTLAVSVILLLLALISFSKSAGQSQNGFELRPRCAAPNPAFAFREVCRSVLNTNSFKFVAANAPSEVVHAFGDQQQRLARLSLQAVSAMLVERLVRDRVSLSSVSRSLRGCVSRVKDASLLVVCNIGRVSLGMLRWLSVGIPRQLQILISAKILTNIGLLVGWEHSGQRALADSVDSRLLPATVTADSTGELDETGVVEDILRALNQSLPNALSRMIFLATVRDNNSGHYYHPEVARRFSPDVADRAMLACHRRIYGQVVALALEDLTDQLDAYMATARASRERLIESWTQLRAYRATIPIDADPISVEIYFMKIEVAVAILEARLPGRIS